MEMTRKYRIKKNKKKIPLKKYIMLFQRTLYILLHRNKAATSAHIHRHKDAASADKHIHTQTFKRGFNEVQQMTSISIC
jgi:hypothetical protein